MNFTNKNSENVVAKLHIRKRQHSENACENGEEYFNKRYDFYCEDKWCLPEPTDIFTKSNWKIDQFLIMKNQLNEIKGQLGQFDLKEWSLHTKYRDPSSDIIKQLKIYIKPEILTQAWCKFYECLSQFPIISKTVVNDKKLNSLHLCEAPGAFVSALNHYLTTNHNDLQWNWLINSLNPEYEGNNLTHMIPDKRLMNFTRNNWRFGADNSGDLTKFCNYQSLISSATNLGKILLVTADGSVDCMSNPGEQESLVEHLHYCEIITALTVLAPEGSFIIKMFTMFENRTICLLYLLYNCFTSLHVFKPCTSKSGNSEVYVICLNYKAKEKFMKLLDKFLLYYENSNLEFSMFSLSTISSKFISQIEECSMFFMAKQIKTINDNVYCFKEVLPHQSRNNKLLKKYVSTCFMTKYKIKPIDKSKYLINNNLNSHLLESIIYDDICEEVSELWNKDSNIEKQNLKLDFLIGKEILVVSYSEFCDINYLKYLQNSTEMLTSDIFNNLFEKHNSNFDTVIHINHSKNNKINCLNLFNQLFNMIRKLTNKNNIAIIGAVFLTRFEACLLFLLVLCFSSIRCTSGIIILRNANHNVCQILELFNEINNKLHEISLKNVEYFVPSILNILPNDLWRNKSYIKFLCKYNNNTISYFLKTIENQT